MNKAIKSGIYKITFISRPDMVYIGSAVNLNDRFIRHRYQLKSGTHKNNRLQRLYNKLGSPEIIFEIIEIINNAQLLIIREQFYLNTELPSLNILKIAGSPLGYKHSQESKIKISIANIGRKMTQTQIDKNILSNKGNRNAFGAKRTDDFKNNLSLIKMKKVLDTSTGVIYKSIGFASEKYGIKYSTLYAKLSGRLRNNTKLSFI